MSFYGVTDLGTYVIGALAIILLPGPNSLYVLSVAASRGARAAYASASGVFLGDLILLSLTGMGAAGLLRSSPELFFWIKCVGAAYLAWIGLSLLASAWRRYRQEGSDAPERVSVEGGSYFLRALWISLLNPKAILFLLSFFVQFIEPGFEPQFVPVAILGGIIMSFSLVYLSALIVAGTRLTALFSRQRSLAAALSGGVGCLFVWFGARLATASLN